MPIVREKNHLLNIFKLPKHKHLQVNAFLSIIKEIKDTKAYKEGIEYLRKKIKQIPGFEKTKECQELYFKILDEAILEKRQKTKDSS